jgi:hypothetical protein
MKLALPRVLCVSNKYAAFQINELYHLEQYYHTQGHKLIATDRLPEELLLYATVGNRFTHDSLMQTLRPLGSVTVHPGCILGTVKVQEITESQARLLIPGVFIFSPVTQILLITDVVKWNVPLRVSFVGRFDRWPKASVTTQDIIRAHITQMSDSEHEGLGRRPELPSDSEGDKEEEEQQPGLGQRPERLMDSDSDGSDDQNLVIDQNISTSSCNVYGPVILVREKPRVLILAGRSISLELPFLSVFYCRCKA